MNHSFSGLKLTILIVGDSVFLLAVTLIGFASHNRSLLDGRWLVTYLPLLFAWLLTAAVMGLYQLDRVEKIQESWRPVVAGLLAAPLAVLLRALWLGQTVVPVFGLVMMATTAAGMGIWRLVWAAWSARKHPYHGRRTTDY